MISATSTSGPDSCNACATAAPPASKTGCISVTIFPLAMAWKTCSTGTPNAALSTTSARRSGSAIVANAIIAQVVAHFHGRARGERPVMRRPDGLFGPLAVAWRVRGDVTSMMVGGIAALLLQMVQAPRTIWQMTRTSQAFDQRRNNGSVSRSFRKLVQKAIMPAVIRTAPNRCAICSQI